LQLTFHQSATVTIESDDVKILCDPWLTDGAFYGSWEQYPHYDFKPENFDDIDYIYISHIHPDHCSAPTLSKLKKNIPVLIHSFPQKFLKNNIERLGFKVIEIPHGTKFHLKGHTHITIFAADDCDPSICGQFFGCGLFQSNTEKMGTNQIDTMCVVENDKEVIVNVNDCPYEMANQVAKKIKNNYPKIDLLLVGYSGASAYPHCYELPLKEKLTAAAKKRETRLLSGENYIRLFSPKYFLPFAGRYTIGGKNYDLNMFRGEPELEDAYDELVLRLQDTNSKGILLNIDETFNITTGKSQSNYKRINTNEKSEYVERVLSKYKYDYEDDEHPDVEKIKQLIPNSFNRFEEHRNGLGFRSDTVILIKISDSEYVSIPCNGDPCKIISKNQLSEYKKFLKLSLDDRLLYRILRGPQYAHWNNADIGAHIHFERVPNVYERGAYYCLNFFHS